MAIGDTYPSEGATVPRTVTVTGVWTGGGGASDCTHAKTDWSRGIVSVKYNAATGKYNLNFLDSPGNQVVGWDVKVARKSGDGALVAVYTAGSYSVSSKSLAFEVWDAATPSLTDLATTDKLLVNVTFCKSAPDQ